MIKFILLFFITLTSCSSKSLQYINIFEANLGSKSDEIGSNIPILNSYSNRQGFTDDFLIDTPELFVANQKIYIADTYNKRVSIFKLNEGNPKAELLLSISNKGKKYSFARPYKVYADRYENIYILASKQDIESYEVQNYSNQTAELTNYQKFQKNLKKIPVDNFYIYKFSTQGEYLFRLGLNGIKTKSMQYPVNISGDYFGNLYVYFTPNTLTNEPFYQVVHRYSSNGILNFKFNTKGISISTNINNTNYLGTILGIYNYIHDEQLLTLTEFQPTTNNLKKEVLPFIENIWSTVNIYSILENEFTKEIFKTKSITEDILGIDNNGRIFFQSYDLQKDTLKIRILNPATKEETIHNAPIHSSYYIMNKYFIDSQGNLYNYIIDRNKKLILLHWDIS